MKELLDWLKGDQDRPFLAAIERIEGRIKFLNSHYSFKDGIKAMEDAKWHGFDNPPEKVWSVKDYYERTT